MAKYQHKAGTVCQPDDVLTALVQRCKSGIWRFKLPLPSVQRANGKVKDMYAVAECAVDPDEPDAAPLDRLASLGAADVKVSIPAFPADALGGPVGVWLQLAPVMAALDFAELCGWTETATAQETPSKATGSPANASAPPSALQSPAKPQMAAAAR